MTSRLFLYAFASATLLSCTPVEQEKYSAYHYGSGQKAVQEETEKPDLPILSETKGFNVNMMDTQLAAMVHEASNIEMQVSELLGRLSDLRNEIAGYALIKKNTVAANPYPVSVETVEPSASAEEAPTALTQTPSSPKLESSEVETPNIQKPSTTPKPTGNGVVNVRYGAHSDKTRLVFDINGSTKHDINFDREVGLVTVTLPATQWSTATNKMYKAAQLSGYEAKEQGQGTVIAMGVANTSSVKSMTLSKPNRLVIDLMK